jgi:hypothetical protein
MKTLIRKPKRPKSTIPVKYEDQLYKLIRQLHRGVWKRLKPIYEQKIRTSLGPALKLAPVVTGLFQTQEEEDTTKRFIATFDAQMDASARKARINIGQQTADDWEIIDDPVYEQILTGNIQLCQDTVDDMVKTTGNGYAKIMYDMRQQILESQASGETLLSLTNRLATYFDENSRWKARRIAHTESARAHNYGTVEGLKDSDNVKGWEWVLSDDACDLCKAVGLDADGLPRQIIKGAIFAFNGSAPAVYSQVKCPPLHPQCRCTVVPVLPFEESRFSSTALIENGKVVNEVQSLPTQPPVLDLTNRPAPPPVKPKKPRKSRAKPKPPAPTAEPVPVNPVTGSFPADPNNLERVKSLGGSTGAELVKDPATGNLYVRKKGANADHLRSEHQADELYRTFGVKVPDSHLYETSTGPVKLARYLDGAKTIAELEHSDPTMFKKAIDKIQRDYGVDAILGNWDLFGMNGDNILVTPDGTPYRVDNGGSLEWRAMGTKKSSLGDKLWTDYPTDLWTITDKKINKTTAPEMLKDMKPTDWVHSVESLPLPGAIKFPDSIPADVQERIKRRVEKAKEAATEFNVIDNDGIFQTDYANDFAKASMTLKNEGVFDGNMPKTMISDWKTGSYKDENGKGIADYYGNGDDRTGKSPWTRFMKIAEKTYPGEWDKFAEYMKQQSYSSSSSEARGMKAFFVRNIMKVNDPEKRYDWHEFKGNQFSFADAVKKSNTYYKKDEKVIKDLVTLQHAYSYNLLRALPLDTKSPDNNRIAVHRTIGKAEQKAAKLSFGQKDAKSRRGLLESFGMTTLFYDEVSTIQSVPIQRGFVSYIQGRDKDNWKALLGNHESELVVIGGGDSTYDVYESTAIRGDISKLLKDKAAQYVGTKP